MWFASHGQAKIVFRPKCAGRLFGNKIRGTGKRTPYIMIRVDGERVYLHRHVWETANGRKLKEGEIVHHVDGNQRNNEPSNLEALAGRSAHLHRHNFHRRADEAKAEKFAEDVKEFGW